MEWASAGVEWACMRACMVGVDDVMVKKCMSYFLMIVVGDDVNTSTVYLSYFLDVYDVGKSGKHSFVFYHVFNHRNPIQFRLQ